jgi:DnaJ-domain-containing protein 1
MMAVLAWLYRSHAQRWAAKSFDQGAANASTGSGRGSGSRGESEHAVTLDAYAVLGVPRSASKDAIRDAYLARMREYHPDKVAHLGEDLQKLAHEKSLGIQQAYREVGG